MSELAISIGVNVLLGVALSALMAWRRTDDDAQLTGPDDALQLFRVHFPDAAGIPALSFDQRSALIDLPGAAGIGLLQRHARRWNARLLVRGDITDLQLQADGVIAMRLADFGWPRAYLGFADPVLRATWVDRLKALKVRDASALGRSVRHA